MLVELCIHKAHRGIPCVLPGLGIACLGDRTARLMIQDYKSQYQKISLSEGGFTVAIGQCGLRG